MSSYIAKFTTNQDIESVDYTLSVKPEYVGGRMSKGIPGYYVKFKYAVKGNTAINSSIGAYLRFDDIEVYKDFMKKKLGVTLTKNEK